MRSTTLLTLASTLACTLAACGGDSGGPVDSGLPAEKTGKELTPAEEETLCVENAEHLARQNSEAEVKNFACVTAGLIFAAAAGNTPAECEAFAEMCRDGAGEEGGEEGGAQMCMFAFDMSTCDATVADIEACLTERNEATGDAIREATCNVAGMMPADPVVGPACSKIQTACPGIA